MLKRRAESWWFNGGSQSELGKRYVEYAVTVTGFDLGDEPGPDGRPLVEAAAHSYTVWRRYSDFVK